MGFLPVLRKKFLHCLSHKFLNFSNGLSSNICNPPNSDKIEFLSEFKSKECKEKSTSFFRDWITFGEKMGRKPDFFARKEDGFSRFSAWKKTRKNPTPSKESDFLFCWFRLTESNRQPTDYDSATGSGGSVPIRFHSGAIFSFFLSAIRTKIAFYPIFS
jgi:hypothetical protein